MTRRSLFGWFAGSILAMLGSLQRSYAGTRSDLQTEDRAEAELMRVKLRAALPYPRIEVSGERALAEWQRLRAAGRGWPVIVGDDDQLDTIAAQFFDGDGSVHPRPPGAPVPETPAEILAKAALLNFPEILAGLPDSAAVDGGPRMGAWPKPGTLDRVTLTVATDIETGEPYERVHILLIPTTRSWEVPAYLRWGNWNACPASQIHVAALKHWSNVYGVELIGIDGSTMNLRAKRRPLTRKEAIALAREQYRYCPDVVDQSLGRLALLAAGFMENDWWYFWWD